MPTGCTEQQPKRVLLVDADDTLWENNIYYQKCERRFCAEMATLGCEAHSASQMLRSCEQELIPRLGYGPAAYVAALQLSSERLLEAHGTRAEADLLARAHASVREIGELVLNPPMILIPAVEATLRRLAPTIWLALVTKGDQAVQAAKVRRSGLASLFDAVYIVAEKSADTYAQIVRELGADREATWMVGNSPRSDINPAVRAGIGAILIPHEDTWTAEIEEIERPEAVTTLRRFSDLLDHFGIPAPRVCDESDGDE
jgi:putative hydrolase of the HAD superfamily